MLEKILESDWSEYDIARINRLMLNSFPEKKLEKLYTR